jgi:hypothetical protein
MELIVAKIWFLPSEALGSIKGPKRTFKSQICLKFYMLSQYK